MRLDPPASPQALASDPRHSAWVSANAGSGKTTVLVQRVIRLLLEGTAPSRILCLTYTKAAAAHMANEVLKKLSTWVRLDDAALDAAISAIESKRPDAARRARARRLFAEALETPGGLKVQTIHAFCDRVLHMFPVEARVPAGFQVLDERGERDLIERARLDALLDAGRKPESELGRALRHCIEICSDTTIQQVIDEAIRERLKLGEIDAERLSRALELRVGDDLASVEREIFEGPNLPRSEWQAVGDTLVSLGGNACRTGERLLRAVAAEPGEAAAAYLAVFFKADGDPRAEKDFSSETTRKGNAALFARIFAEAERAPALRERLRRICERDRSLALLTLASAVITRYEAMKRQRGALDFADLVTRTVELLEREESAWVHYKLDGGIDHILVDEAQDTSPEQWRIIAKLAEEFFSGSGASPKDRTIFAVGDEKQSIYSFQGADPRRFDEMRRAFAAQIAAAGGVLNEPRLRQSYRSTDLVLRAVDKVFEQPHAHRGLSAFDPKGPFHEAVRRNAPSVVEIWPALKSEKQTGDEDGWDKPLDRTRQSSGQMQLARQIARAVKHWTEGGLSIEDRNAPEQPRRVRAGDIVILVQSRGVLFDAILRTLKKEGIDVAGADRLTLTQNIAVMDLMALGDALLLERDDLSLACALKSPLFGFGDDDLFALCHDRKGTLADALAHAEEPRFAEAAKKLARWRAEARHMRPFDFYARVLGRDGGRKEMLARLGPESADALDEFLSAALSYESSETPSLQGFLRFLRRSEAEIKRDLETESTSVRVMTVHGVKGLEAPVVVLADTTCLPHPTKEPRVIPVSSKDGDSALIWKLGKENSRHLADARDHTRERRLEEYRRLLYVALTRAADVLVVGGYLNKRQNEADQGSWYDLVTGALVHDANEPALITKHQVDYCETEISRWRAIPVAALAPEAVSPTAPAAIPDWLTRTEPAREKHEARLRPSHAPRPLAERRAGTSGGRARGTLLHRLLQSLPELKPEQQEIAASRYLHQAAPDLPQPARAALVQEALAVMRDPQCALLFGAGSRAEPELIARIALGEREVEIAARLDRIVVTQSEVIFADFKSDGAVPALLREIPAHYISQLAAYRAAVSQTFPGRRVRAWLVFTAAPRVFEVPEEMLASAWLELRTQGSPAAAGAPA